MISIINFFIQNKFLVSKLDYRSKTSFDFINSLYSNEEFVIFEHSPYHIFSYLSYDHDIYSIESQNCKAVLGLKDNLIIIFTPKVLNITEFKLFLTELKIKHLEYKVKIQNVSEKWITDHYPILKDILSVYPRSKEEAVYDVKLLTKLEGHDFAKLRNINNKLIKTKKIIFEKITQKNIEHAFQVLEKWQLIQGHKYQKDKYEKEKHVYCNFLEFTRYFPEDVLFEIGYLGLTPVSVYIIHKVLNNPEWVVFYTIKGINKKEHGGIHGVSDATYCHAFFVSNIIGALRINDGELGMETGTRIHKMGFKPVSFIKSFDLY